MWKMFCTGRIEIPIIVVVLLGICAMHDIRSKTIPGIWIWITLGIGGIYRLIMIVFKEGALQEGLFCLIPGIGLLLLSHLCGMVGDGDGWLIIAVGLCLEWISLLHVLYYSFLSIGVFSLGYLIIGHKNRKDTIPFAPFLLLAIMIFVVRDFV